MEQIAQAKRLLVGYVPEKSFCEELDITPRTARRWREIAGKGVAEGQRNITAARLTGYLLRHYVDPPVVLDLMLAWNAMHCAPPLEEDELVKIVNSIAGRELKRRAGT